MSGHSKWAQIKRKKGVTDTRRGQLFTKLARELTVAVHEGGPSPGTNYRLRLAMQKAKDNNMPLSNIERAIKRASGGNGQEALEEIVYEGYGPGGVAIMLQTLTSNRKRTASDVRTTLSRAGGNLGESGCVSWKFERKGVITMETEPEKAEEILLLAIDAGAEDVKVEGGYIEIYTLPEGLERVRRQLEASEIEVDTAELSMIPKSTVSLDVKTASRALRLLDAVEELPDVQRVYANADFPEEALEQYSNET
jgi:YebC/PmpR family DNA-binding regulatory protein